MKVNELFRKFSLRISVITGKAWTFIIALLIIITWAVSGPFFGFSNRWQLFINTGTTIVTLLMVFIIQNTQNRDSKAIHIKLDELLRKMKGEHYMNLEELPDEEIEKIQERFRKLHGRYEEELKKRAKRRKAASKKN